MDNETNIMENTIENGMEDRELTEKDKKREIAIKRNLLLTQARSNIQNNMQVYGFKIMVADSKNYLLKHNLIQTDISLDQNHILTGTEKQCCEIIFRFIGEDVMSDSAAV